MDTVCPEALGYGQASSAAFTPALSSTSEPDDSITETPKQFPFASKVVSIYTVPVIPLFMADNGYFLCAVIATLNPSLSKGIPGLPPPASPPEEEPP